MFKNYFLINLLVDRIIKLLNVGENMLCQNVNKAKYDYAFIFMFLFKNESYNE